MAQRTLYVGGHVYSAADPFATAMLVIGDEVAWIGDDAGAQVHRDDVDAIVQLRGTLVTPAFVDAHVHATSTGLLLNGLDLSGCSSLAEALDRIRRHPPADGVLIGHGWDDTGWPEGRPLTTTDIDAIVGDRSCYLSRIDVHSAVVSTATRREHPDLVSLPGYDPVAPLTAAAHHRVRGSTLGSITATQREAAQRASLHRAVSLGIASIHEMAGPSISGEDDLVALLALASEPGMPSVVGYWGELDGHDRALALGARGAGGDLFVDGSLGSHTACLRAPYADDPANAGRAYLDAEAVARHVTESTRLGRQAGFHVIGDRAHDIVVAGFRAAVAAVGPAAVVAARHRIEHVEMPDASHLAEMAMLGIVASAQSAFDAAWGGEQGMYRERLGVERARAMNPFAAFLSSGVILALGSDAPVTPLDPWGSVRAAALHRTPEHRISVRAAFAAHTRGGRRAAREEHLEPGVLAPGTPATFAIWEPTDLVVQAPDERIAAWSTDPRSGTPGLPDLAGGRAAPACWRTVIRGEIAYDVGALA